MSSLFSHRDKPQLKPINALPFRYKNQDEDLLPNADTFTLSPHRIKCHHPNCPKMNQNTPDGSTKCLKSQMIDTHSISGSIVIQNNCNNSQLSSPDVSEANALRKYSSSSANVPSNNSGNEEKDDKQKTILLKIPSVIKAEQLSVSTVVGDEDVQENEDERKIEAKKYRKKETVLRIRTICLDHSLTALSIFCFVYPTFRFAFHLPQMLYACVAEHERFRRISSESTIIGTTPFFGNVQWICYFTYAPEYIWSPNQ